MLRVELHCHTSYSKDCLTAPRTLVEARRRKGLDWVVVTDHNSIEGARIAHELDPEGAIVGEEIMTTRGELLAAYVSKEIPAGLAPREAIERLRDQDSFISVSHPFDAARKGAWRLDDLLDIAPLVDAIEVFNSRCMVRSANSRSLEFARQHSLAGTVGSDAHTVFELGRSTMLLEPFSDAASLRTRVRSGVSEVRWSAPWIHLTSRYARLSKWFASGLDITRRT